MNGNTAAEVAPKIRLILPVILRITFSLVLWTLGGATMTFTENQTYGYRPAQAVPSSIPDPPGGPDHAVRRL